MTKTILTVDITEVRPSDDNVRDNVGDVTGLAASIASEGLQHPIAVYETAPGGPYEILHGHRRYAATVEAGESTIDVVLHDPPADAASATVARLIENCHRADLTPLEQARAFQALADAGLSQRDIEARTGIIQSQVSKRLALLLLPSKILTAFDQGDLTNEEALALAKIGRHDPSMLDTVWDKITTDTYLPASRHISTALEKIKRAKARAKTVADLQAEHADDGIHVWDVPSWDGDQPDGVYVDELWCRRHGVDLDRLTDDETLHVVVDPHGQVRHLCTDPDRYPRVDATPDADRGPDPREEFMRHVADRADVYLDAITRWATDEPPAGGVDLSAALLTLLDPGPPSTWTLATMLGLDREGATQGDLTVAVRDELLSRVDGPVRAVTALERLTIGIDHHTAITRSWNAVDANGRLTDAGAAALTFIRDTCKTVLTDVEAAAIVAWEDSRKDVA